MRTRAKKIRGKTINKREKREKNKRKKEKKREKKRKQAGAELCQAQDSLG